MDLALGEVGLSKDVFLRMTWGNLWRKIYGYWIRQDREWDRTRVIVAAIVNKNRSKKTPYKKPERIMPLAIDKMGMSKYEWTDEKYEKFDQALKAWDLNKGHGSSK